MINDEVIYEYCSNGGAKKAAVIANQFIHPGTFKLVMKNQADNSEMFKFFIDQDQALNEAKHYVMDSNVTI